MSVSHLKLYTQPEVPLETEVINPSVFANLSQSGIEHLHVMHGNVKCKLGDFFKVTGKGASEIHIEGNLSRVKLIGAGMTEGKIIVDGDVGMHLGVGMSGLPIPRSIMSSPFRLNFIFKSLTSAKTYGGSLVILLKSSID